METRALGRSGLRVSVLGLGAATFGSYADAPTARAILDRAVAAGVTLVDLAETYPVPATAGRAGRSEEIVGAWLSERRREDVVVATKVAGPPAGGLRWPVRGGDTRLDGVSLERALDGSLRRLRTDYVDLYQTHRPDPTTPLDETLGALARFVAAGKVRAVGVCNESPEGLARVAARAGARGDLRIDAVQASCNLLAPGYADALAPVCVAHGVGLVAYSSLAGGVLSGKYAGGARPHGARFSRPAGDDEVGRQGARVLGPGSDARVAYLMRVARDAGMPLATLAVAWAMRHPAVSSVLLGASRPEQLGVLLAAAHARLPADVLEACARGGVDG